MAGRTALEKLKQASELDKLADGLKKRDPSTSTAIQDEANKKRKAAVKQMKKRPKKAKTKASVV